jgi:hypothetical protein
MRREEGIIMIVVSVVHSYHSFNKILLTNTEISNNPISKYAICLNWIPISFFFAKIIMNIAENLGLYNLRNENKEFTEFCDN